MPKRKGAAATMRQEAPALSSPSSPLPPSNPPTPPSSPPSPPFKKVCKTAIAGSNAPRPFSVSSLFAGTTSMDDFLEYRSKKHDLSELDLSKPVDVHLLLQYGCAWARAGAPVRKVVVRNNTLPDPPALAMLRSLRVQGLDLSGCSQLADDALAQFVTNFSGARRLVLGGLSKLTDKGLQQVISLLPHLQELDLESCAAITYKALRHLPPQLKRLRLSRCFGLTTEGQTLTHFAQQGCPQLQELDLSYCPWTTDQVLLHLSKKNFPALQVLSLQYCAKITDAGVAHLSGNLPLLRRLSLSTCFKLTDAIWAYLSAANFPALEELDISDCSLLTGEESSRRPRGKKPLKARASSLRKLNLSRCYELKDAGLRDLVARFPALQDLNLSECKKLTKDGLPFLSQLTDFQRLDLTDCKGLLDTKNQ